ncbi:hypothetical protein [Nannocystis radixulma]|uniref:Uncharacterized protein n=1 Tax=Nannocystis radixulma TaxID=2995305 RepID=A0ABT5AYI4_9BACT|nr:hypothetical protein [Nannocystis radixulma]MDC0666900.1 hypothetical protein [Nannocystis radixulma]
MLGSSTRLTVSTASRPAASKLGPAAGFRWRRSPDARQRDLPVVSEIRLDSVAILAGSGIACRKQVRRGTYLRPDMISPNPDIDVRQDCVQKLVVAHCLSRDHSLWACREHPSSGVHMLHG